MKEAGLNQTEIDVGTMSFPAIDNVFREDGIVLSYYTTKAVSMVSGTVGPERNVRCSRNHTTRKLRYLASQQFRAPYR